MSEQLILIAYDIQCHNARSAALRQLRKVAISYQDSVFELHLTIPKLQQLLHNLQALINPNDSLLAIPHCLLAIRLWHSISARSTASDTLMTTLLIEKHGITLEYASDVLVMREPDTPPRTLPLARIDKLICLHNTQLTTQLLGQLQQRGIDFIVINNRYSDHSVALYANTHGNSMRRTAQYALQLNDAIRLPLAKSLCQHKFHQSLRVLETYSPHRIQSQLQIASESLPNCITEQQLRGLEGSAQRALFQYWRQSLDPKWGFERRQRRPPPDPVNGLLSLIYTLVHHEAIRQCKQFGLDSTLGIYHRLSYGRHSLACDLMEPVRPWLEHWLVQLLAKDLLNLRHFTQGKQGCYLGKTGRLLFYPQFETQMPSIRRKLAANARWLVQQLNQGIAQGHVALPEFENEQP
ncbi:MULTISPECIES: CRISPR-associated endonuclease Cas1 [unclassified Shewanella]|uniref:CRISPR-associated endonuclease Cas1 n=1 Tax=unclassified Shewanella TaxID=196818 RepID=UPI0015E38802|nr:MULTISPECIES: CRISPR-associated endonuclease Cas1 [unclassified Shewanella]